MTKGSRLLLGLGLGLGALLMLARNRRQSTLSLGLTAAANRPIRPKSEYLHLIEPLGALDRTDPVINRDGDTDETVGYMIDIVREYSGETSRLARTLKGKNLWDTLSRVWGFVFRYIKYEPDDVLFEQLRRPLRTLHDQKGDCDCYSILIGSILHNLGIPFHFRVTAYDDPNRFQHVYVIVPKPGGGYYTVDPVVDAFDYEKPFSNHKDYKFQ